MIEQEFKDVYNGYLKRYKKAEIFFNADNVTTERKLKFLNNFNEVVQALSLLMLEFKARYGRDMTDKEINEGF